MNLGYITTWAVDEAPFPTIESFSSDSTAIDYGRELIWKNGEVSEQLINPVQQATRLPEKMSVLPKYNSYINSRTGRKFQSIVNEGCREELMMSLEEHRQDKDIIPLNMEVVDSCESGRSNECESRNDLNVNYGSSSIITRNDRWRRRRNKIKRNMRRENDKDEKIMESIKDLEAKMEFNEMNHRIIMNNMGVKGMEMEMSDSHFPNPNPGWNGCMCPPPKHKTDGA